MEEILIIILQFLAEFAFDALAGVTAGISETYFVKDKARRLALRNILWFIAGCVLAGISLLFLQQTLLPFPFLRIINMVLAPVTAGFIAQAFAQWRSKRKWFITPRHYFWHSFWFALGFTLIRFAFAVR